MGSYPEIVPKCIVLEFRKAREAPVNLQSQFCGQFLEVCLSRLLGGHRLLVEVGSPHTLRGQGAGEAGGQGGGEAGGQGGGEAGGQGGGKGGRQVGDVTTGRFVLGTQILNP